jgi:hypothetical protein
MKLPFQIWNHRKPRPRTALLLALCSMTALSAAAQVNPAEIANPQLKAPETEYFQQLIALNRIIAATKFPFEFNLSRYVGLDPDKQKETDTRGLEFVKFRDRIILKITGNYNAAYNAEKLTQNQRASRTYREVVLPVLRLVTRALPPEMACDGIGFEISHHVRRMTKSSDYEGKEILVVVFDREKAFQLAGLAEGEQQQDVLNQSMVYVNGKEFGLAVNQEEPIELEALNKSSSPAAPPSAPSASPSSASSSPLLASRGNLNLGATRPGGTVEHVPANAIVAPGSSGPPDKSDAPGGPGPGATQKDVERLQTKFQPQLDALGKEGVNKFHFVEYAPPSIALFRRQIILQMTLRNPKPFDPETTSIYKRAARSFDLFLAPQLRAMVEKLPPDLECEGLDITVLNQLGPKSSSSEALEFVLPLPLLRQFVDAEITNQELINHSVILVNGVRIAINLQQVE